MKKVRKIAALLLVITITVSLLAAMASTASAAQRPVRYDNITRERHLYDALNEINNSYSTDVEYIIYITNSFEYNREINIYGRSVYDDETGDYIGVAGRNVRIDLDDDVRLTLRRTGTAISIWDGSSLTFSGEGVVDITSAGTGFYGISIANSSELRLSGKSTMNVNMSGRNSVAVYSANKGRVDITSITVEGLDSIGARAQDGGRINVSGNVTATGVGATAVRAENDGSIEIKGSVTADGRDSVAVYSDKSVVDVGGDIEATSSGSIGVYARNGGRILARGTLSGGAVDVRIDSINREATRPMKTGVTLSGTANRGIFWHEFSREATRVYLRASSVTDGWQQIGKDWYYYRNRNLLTESWILDGGAWYYLKDDGKMAAGEWVRIDARARMRDDGTRYYFYSNGKMATGWVQDRGDWYYLLSSGAMARNQWLQENDVWYWLKENGRMAANETITISGARHTFSGSGAWVNPNR